MEIYIKGVLYLINVMVIRNKDVNKAYNMLLDSPWLVNVKVNYDLGSKVVTIQGYGTLKNISMNQPSNPYLKLPKVEVCYTYVEDLPDIKEDLLLTEKNLVAVGKIILPEGLVEGRS